MTAAFAETPAKPTLVPAGGATAIFAGGRFWCLEKDFKKLPGVIEVESGYTAGRTSNPSYEQVSAGGTGHTEAVRLICDPQKASYPQLVDYFWRHIDPTVKFTHTAYRPEPSLWVCTAMMSPKPARMVTMEVPP